MPRPPAGQAGLGLIEFLVSLLLLTIMITGTMALQLTSLRTTTESRTSSLAITLAQTKLEELRSMRPDLACAAAGTWACFDYEASVITVGETAGAGPVNPSPPCTGYFQRFTSVTNSGPGSCTIVVDVMWTGATGPQRITQGMDRRP